MSIRNLAKKLPYPIKQGLKYIYGVIPLPIRYGKVFRDAYRFLQESQWWSGTKLENYHMQQLSKLLHRAYENVPYYRRIFEEKRLRPKDIQNFDDLKKLPVLTRHDTKDKFEELKAKDFEIYKPILNHTSGLSGIPLKFYLDKNNWIFERATVIRHWAWLGYSPKERQAVLRGAVPDSNEYFLINKDVLILSSFLLNPEMLDKYVDKILEFNPKLIRGYPSSLEFFATLIKERKIYSI